MKLMTGLKMLKIVLLAMTISYGAIAKADTQVVYFPNHVDGVMNLSKSVKDFIISLIKYRCPYAYATADKIVVTKVVVTDSMLQALMNGASIYDASNSLVATEFAVKYDEELKLDNDSIRMTLAEMFVPFEETDNNKVSLISLDSSGAICR